jgi:hypothetical protein
MSRDCGSAALADCRPDDPRGLREPLASRPRRPMGQIPVAAGTATGRHPPVRCYPSRGPVCRWVASAAPAGPRNGRPHISPPRFHRGVGRKQVRKSLSRIVEAEFHHRRRRAAKLAAAFDLAQGRDHGVPEHFCEERPPLALGDKSSGLRLETIDFTPQQHRPSANAARAHRPPCRGVGP